MFVVEVKSMSTDSTMNQVSWLVARRGATNSFRRTIQSVLLREMKPSSFRKWRWPEFSFGQLAGLPN
jgi:hypothetical protein